MLMFICQQNLLSYQCWSHTCNVHPDMCHVLDKRYSQDHIHFPDILFVFVDWWTLLSHNFVLIVVRVESGVMWSLKQILAKQKRTILFK